MDKQQFLAEVERQFRIIFVALKHSRKAPLVEKHRCEGFMRAGVFCDLVSKEELNTLMEAVHLDVIGESIADRDTRMKGKWKDQEVDYSSYEPPAIERID